MQVVTSSAVLELLGDAAVPLLAKDERTLAPEAVRNGSVVYFCLSEQRPGEAKLFLAHCLDIRSHDCAHVGGYFISMTGAGCMRDRAYSLLWTAGLVLRVPRIVALVGTGRKADFATADALAEEIGGSLTGAGSRCKLSWINALGTFSDDSLDQLCDWMRIVR